ncbi:hypothetical protein ACFYU9_09815 [Streptomyces sp. NPDC004327]|uniref:hypothetical protein n=1 Tax=Streptomyces sp. NPDC004327 TaxID=3364699 RepID=UPI00368AB31B
MSETRRAHQGAERLLLLAALLLGLVTMHTLGHGAGPEHGAAPARTARVAPLTAPMTTAGHAPMDRQAAPAAGHVPDAPATGHGTNALATGYDTNAPAASHAPDAPVHHSGSPLAVCLAVLGALVVVLGGVALRGARRWAGRARARTAGAPWSGWPHAPPASIPVLERVAVLRI